MIFNVELSKINDFATIKEGRKKGLASEMIKSNISTGYTWC